MTTTSRASFTATPPPVASPDRVDLLGRLVPTAIRRPPKGTKVPNPFRLTLITLVTAGVVPAAWLIQRAGRMMSQQNQQMDLAVDLIESTGRSEDVATLREAARNVRPTRPSLYAALAALLVAVVAGVGYLAAHGITADTVRQLWFHWPARSDPWSVTALVALSACPLIVIAALNRHTVSLQQFTIAFNAALDVADRGEPLEAPRLVWGLKPLHVLLGVAMAAAGVFWGLPMMLGWAALHTVSFDTTQRFRIELADRLQAMSGVAPETELADRCADPQCRAALPFPARFCPRCGKAVSA